jgi:hypothetical protein
MLSNTFTELLLPSLMRNNSQPFKDYLKAFEIPLKTFENEANLFAENIFPETTLWFDFLFWALGSEQLNWKDHSIVKKRAILKQLFEIYKEKGTQKGYNTILRLMCDKSLIAIKTPPSKSFAGRSTTAEEKELYESKFPEIRIYHFSDRSQRHSLFCGRFLAKYARGCGYKTDARQRVGKRATLYDPVYNTETALHDYATQNYYAIGLKGKKTGAFCGSCIGGYTVDQNSQSRLYMIKSPRGYETEIERRTYAYPSLQPITLFYKENRLKGKVKGTFVDHSKMDHSYLVKQNAEYRIFKSIRLHCPDRAITKRWQGSQFLGLMKFGNLQPFNIALYPDMSVKGSKRTFYLGKAGFFFMPSIAQESVHKAIWAMNYMRPAGVKARAFINNHVIRMDSEMWYCNEKYKCDDLILEV